MKKMNLKFSFENDLDITSNLNCIDGMKDKFLFKINFKDGKYKTPKEISEIIIDDKYIKFNEQYETSSITLKEKENCYYKLFTDNIKSIEVYSK